MDEVMKRKTLESATKKGAAGLGKHVGVLKEGIMHANSAAAKAFDAQTDALKALAAVDKVKAASEFSEEFMDQNADIFERLMAKMRGGAEKIAAAIEIMDRCEGSAQEILSMTRRFPLMAIEAAINEQLGKLGTSLLEPSNLKEAKRNPVERVVELPEIDDIVPVKEGDMPVETIVRVTMEPYTRSGNLFAAAVEELESAQRNLRESSGMLRETVSCYRKAHDSMQGGELTDDTKTRLRKLGDEVQTEAGELDGLAGELGKTTESAKQDMLTILQNMGRFIRSAFVSSMYSEGELIKPVTQEEAVASALEGNIELLDTYMGQDGADLDAVAMALGRCRDEQKMNAVEALTHIALSSKEKTKATDILHELSSHQDQEISAAALAAIVTLSEGVTE